MGPVLGSVGKVILETAMVEMVPKLVTKISDSVLGKEAKEADSAKASHTIEKNSSEIVPMATTPMAGSVLGTEANEVASVKVSRTVEKTRSEIAPESAKLANSMLGKEANDFVNDPYVAGKKLAEILPKIIKFKSSDVEKNLDKSVKSYFKDLQSKSECPNTILKEPFKISDLRKLTPEKLAKMRDEFDDIKSDLKKEWEERNGRSWPKYHHDVYSANGKLIRKIGSDYDAHHIQPLCLGGKNEVDNITPIRAEIHYDKQGIHSPESPYNQIVNTLGDAGR